MLDSAYRSEVPMKTGNLVFCLIPYIVASSVWAAYPDALAAAERGDYAGAYQQFSELAEKGNTDALVNMWLLTEESCGLKKSPALADELICKAVSAGNVHARAWAALSNMFAAPLCPTWTFNQGEFPAITLASAMRGNVAAMLWSGKIYENGGTPDPVSAYAWYTLASKRGASEAQEDADSIAKRLSVDDRVRAQELAEKLDRDTEKAQVLFEPCRSKRH
jgi:TPR repeat protein